MLILAGERVNMGVGQLLLRLSVLILAGERVNMCVGQLPLCLSVLILAGVRVNMCVGQLPLCLSVFVVCTNYSCFGSAHILPCFFVSLFVASCALVHFHCCCVKKRLQTGRVKMFFLRQPTSLILGLLMMLLAR